jgi:CRISPR-associated protein Csm4
MPEIIPYHLTFHGGLRIGTHGVNLEESGVTIPSDTLFSALLDNWRGSGGPVEEWLAPFISTPPDPPFLLTSTFPFAGKVRFYPMPVNFAAMFVADTLAGRGKQIKLIRFFSEALLLKALSGEKLDAWLFPEEGEDKSQGTALQNGVFWLSENELENLPEEMRSLTRHAHALRFLPVWQEQRVPHVTIDRLTSASTIFHTGRVVFAPGCGLWFGVHWRSNKPGGIDYRQAFEQTLGILEGSGIGGDRSAGCGQFRFYRAAPQALPEIKDGNLAFLLSRYHPRQDELPGALSAHGAAYRLEAVGGWLKSPDGAAQRRKRLLLVAEGSLVSIPALPAGSLADVTPEYTAPAGQLPHRVYRSGFALACGWPDGEEKHA